MELFRRENEILRILDLVSKSGINFVVVGGYAVSTHSRHRFSVDCDLVATSKNSDLLEPILVKEGFRKGLENTQFDKKYGGKFIQYVKKVGDSTVTMDLLTDSLVCRQTDAAWSYDYITSNSTDANVPGIQDSVRVKIPTKELLMAFKLHSARKPDVRDVVMLGEEADWDAVFHHLNRGSLKKLKTSLNQFIKSLDDKKLVNSLKGEFRLTEDVSPKLLRSRERVLNMMDRMNKSAE